VQALCLKAAAGVRLIGETRIKIPTIRMYVNAFRQNFWNGIGAAFHGYEVTENAALSAIDRSKEGYW
jgi:hypothetical protein